MNQPQTLAGHAMKTSALADAFGSARPRSPFSGRLLPRLTVRKSPEERNIGLARPSGSLIISRILCFELGRSCKAGYTGPESTSKSKIDDVRARRRPRLPSLHVPGRSAVECADLCRRTGLPSHLAGAARRSQWARTRGSSAR